MEKSKAMAPMTKEEWEKRQSVVRRVQDEETGRYRLFYLSKICLVIKNLHNRNILSKKMIKNMYTSILSRYK